MKTNLVAIDQEMRRSYLDYSMSVIIGRAIPDVRDGLKPVHRRVLFAMHEQSNTHNRPYKKSARIVGDVIGKYHPHGDAAVYDTIVRMAQDFSMRYPLVDGQGNFGSVDGDPPAAMRYTEVRMERIAEEMLVDIEKETVDMHPNYDESLQEPDVLPTRIPTLLLNGSSGIAVGMATSVPPHNSTEIITALIALIDSPNISLADLMKLVPGPDFPTGGIIFSNGEIEKAYSTGRGIITVRGKAEIERDSNRERIIITELPYTVNKADLVTRIVSLAQDKKIDGISNLRDESDKDGMRVVIDLKRGSQPEVIEKQLYKLTNLQTSFSLNMLAIHNGRPRMMGLKDLLQAFLDFREEVVTRRSIFELGKAKARVHILEGLLKALDHIDEVVSIIKASSTPQEARDNLVKRFGFSEIQAQAILDMRLQRLTGLERDKITDEYKMLLKDIERLEKILSDRDELLKVIRAELEEIREKYSDERRSLIVRGSGADFDIEDLIPDEQMVVTMTRKGYIKRTELDKYRTQKRGGVGVRGGLAADDDFIEHIFVASNHASILYFTNTGRVYHTKVYEIPERDRALKGVPIVNIRPLQKEERICAILVTSDLTADARVIMVTARAYTKRVMLRDFANIIKTGIIACTLEPGDEVISARLTTGNDHIIVASGNGKAIVFSEDQVRVMGRQAQGVRAIYLDEGDLVVGMDVITSPDDYVINLTEFGYGKKTPVGKYPVQKRAGKGVLTVHITKKTGNLVGIRVVQGSDELIIISSSGQIIRMPVTQIRTTTTRSAQGVRAIRMKENEKIVDFTRYVGEEA
ncbi:MAG TPA: DNA gyrase subunit A [Deltaproteobacteria bacterium]|jgi:DNA gyrase subunit A|nr:DNA gyrase subunit A [Pseudomonadota bacterium]HPX50452.1 DNA gyrase subunit A [Deltaproteobacteria bacterium]HRR21013.1 DNA gyrase subunit A [Desulfomonilia bacterium]HQO79686.1 DNA gyrase subunit A [Deltaproteobacteria bacterium]HRR68713.1 DNA gyrase subunit A [Desulfomonilia bacterium]